MSVEIPYVSQPRPDTGLTNAKLAIWLFLASEVMLFGALFSSYVLLRVSSTEWPMPHQVLNVPLATLNTFILITSSITMVMSWASLELKDFSKFKKYLLATNLLGVLFLVVKGFEYGAKFSHDLYPSTSIFYAIYFTLTGIHVLHVIAGLVVNFYFLFPGSKMYETEPERFTGRIEIAGLYWHFVDLVWIFLFPTIYLL